MGAAWPILGVDGSDPSTFFEKNQDSTFIMYEQNIIFVLGTFKHICQACLKLELIYCLKYKGDNPLNL